MGTGQGLRVPHLRIVFLYVRVGVQLEIAAAMGKEMKDF